MSKKVKAPVKKGVAKVPVVMQLEALECGAASLDMILAYYGKWVPLEQARVDCGVSRDGSNARNILLAARHYGLKAAGYRYETSEALRDNGEFPCIVHWNFNHFVVLCGFKGNKAVLNDPAKGNYTVSMQAFDEAFTGICLMFEPTEDFVPGGKKRSVADFARNRLKGGSTAVIFTVSTAVISTLIGIINPVFSRIFIDRLLTHRNDEWLMPFIYALSVMSAIQLILAWLTAVYSLRIRGKMAVTGSTGFMWKVLRLPMEFFSQRMAGDILSRQSSNAGIADTLVNTLAPLFLNTVMMVFYLVVMIRYSVILAAVGILSILINAFVGRIISKKRINITRVQMRDRGKLSGTTAAGIEMIETIQSSGAENGFFEKWAGYQAGVNAQDAKYAKLNQYLGMIPAFVSEFCSLLIMGIGIALTFGGSFTLGMLTAFQGFMGHFSGPAMEIISAGQTMQEMRTEMERIEDVMEYPDDPALNRKEEGAEEYSKLTGDIEMKNVTFGYSRLGKPVVTDFSMHLKPGSSVAFVGSSGCGKSTLSKLISGLVFPWSGEILYDGKPLAEIDRGVFTGSLAVVDQDIILFEDTIAENIRMWDKSIEDFEVIMAARDAQIHEDIMRREGGYRYKLQEGGKDFSGGQRQRLEIARVLAQDPTVVILDEATSALDAKTEYDVVKAIKDRGITCIVVAHRLSTVRDCDEIIVLDHGTVCERGMHEELMKLNGRYTQLVTNE